MPECRDCLLDNAGRFAAHGGIKPDLPLLPMTIDTVFYCAYCWRPNHIDVDEYAGARQEYVEDCQVCCRPNLLRIQVDRYSGEPTVEAERESDGDDD